MSEVQQYAISEYHNTEEIYDRLNVLINQPIRPMDRYHQERVHLEGWQE